MDAEEAVCGKSVPLVPSKWGRVAREASLATRIENYLGAYR